MEGHTTMNKLNNAPLSYSFDDFILVPLYSTVKSRKDPDISVKIKNFQYDIPVVSSPMNTVTETDMLVTMHNLGGVGVLHRYMSIKSQVKIVDEVIARLKYVANDVTSPNHKFAYQGTAPFYVAVGANGDFEERVRALRDAGVIGFCIDVANGHNELSIQAVRTVRSLVPDAKVMAGNVCTFEGAYRLAVAGANSIRVGIGPSGVCTTRQVTGHGVPQLTAIEDCVRIKEVLNGLSFKDVAIIADGGIRRGADVIKSLAIGADAVMLGSLLSGTEETPGEWLEENGVLYKYYCGMASDEARERWMGKPKVGIPEEGVSKKIIYHGRSAVKVVENLCASVKVGLSFSNARNVSELRKNAKWMRVSGAGYIEGTPHGK